MPDSHKEQPRNLSLDISADEMLGTYANLAIISHSPSEFVLDFARLMPGVESAKVVRRIIMTPDHAKRLLRALGENLHRFEMEYGEIELPENEGALPNNFTNFSGNSEA